MPTRIAHIPGSDDLAVLPGTLLHHGFERVPVVEAMVGLERFAEGIGENPGQYSRFAIGGTESALFDADLGAKLFVQSAFTTQRGGNSDYNQWTNTIGYRFDNRGAMRRAERAKGNQP